MFTKVNNLTPTESLILNVFLWVDLIILIMYYEIGYIKRNYEFQDLIYSIHESHSSMKEFLKYSDLQVTILNELTCWRELLNGGSKS